MSKPSHRDFDYILSDLVGGAGWWQLKTILSLYPMLLASTYPLLISVFAAYAPDHRCFIPGCDTNETGLFENFTRFAIPKDHVSDNFLQAASKFDPCHKYALTDGSGTCQAESFSANLTEKCISGFVYDQSQMTETLTTRLDLVCEDDYKRRLLDSVIMGGLMLGSLIGGWIGDRWGRKTAMYLSLLTTIPGVLIGGVVVNYYVYMITRIVTCTALPIMWINGHTYAIEFLSAKHRRLYVAFSDLPTGGLIFVFIIYLTRHWSYLHVGVAIACSLGLPVWFLVPESPRWLAGNNRKDEAEKILLEIAEGNGMAMTPAQRKEMLEIIDHVDQETEKTLNYFDMFQSSYIIRTGILLCAWSSVCVGYYSLGFSTTRLSGDIVMNCLYGYLVGSPTVLLLYYSTDGMGRRWTMCGSLGVLGLACTILAFIPKSDSTIILIIYLIGKAAAGIGFHMVYLVTSEMFPTNLRAQALGFCSMFSRIFGFSASFLEKLSVYWPPLPMLVLALPALLASCLTLLLMETSGADLPQNMKEGIEIHRIQDSEMSKDHPN